MDGPDPSDLVSVHNVPDGALTRRTLVALGSLVPPDDDASGQSNTGMGTVSDPDRSLAA